MRPGDTGGEAQRRQGNMALQHARHTFAQTLRCSARPGPERARNIRGAIQILAAGINQIAFIGMNGAMARFRRAVMHNGAVFARAADGGKTLRLKQRHIAPHRQQLCGGGDFI